MAWEGGHFLVTTVETQRPLHEQADPFLQRQRFELGAW